MKRYKVRVRAKDDIKSYWEPVIINCFEGDPAKFQGYLRAYRCRCCGELSPYIHECCTHCGRKKYGIK